MLREGVRRILRPALVGAAVAAAASACGCVDLAKNNYFLPGGVDQTSPVAGDIARVQQTSGPFPRFSQIPPAPTDVRPLSAWRADIAETLGEKRQVDINNARYPYTLGDTEAFAAAARARIPPDEATPPGADATAAAEAYAAAHRARAMPPPPPK